ncbi:hypothetical protein [uncultured Phenylobacterium sp.]|uniref:hypothetical protein n=1 Tax=uncultured Phenylobacterium sp. TaxID=349273 RepID=UPI0025EFAEB6|nr:hypothetical protein [uncultured Phenylobacterium sp.]
MRGRKLCIGAGLAALTLLLVGCTALPGGARVVGNQGPGPLFRGLTQPLPSEREPSRRYIFHIHGMGLTDRTLFHSELYDLLRSRYANAEVKRDWETAGLDPPMRVRGELLDCDKPWTDHLNPKDSEARPCEFPTFGTYRVDRFWNPQGGQEVWLYSYFWHRDLWRIQEPHLREDMKRHDGKPAFLNSALKRNILDGGLSDAASYVGPAGDLVKAGVSAVLCRMARDAAGLETPTPRSLETCGDLPPPSDDVQFGFVSHSLGSRMLYDVLAPRAPRGQVELASMGAARQLLIQRADVVYMAANQLPLLALGRVEVKRAPLPAGGGELAPAPDPGRDRCSSQVSLLEARRRLRNPGCPPGGAGPEATPLGGELQVVAFHDPDDILGYRAGDAAPIGDTTGDGGVFIDVIHRNAAQIAWTLTLPNLAHDHELKRRETQDMILCGAKVAAKGRVEPYPCPRIRR